MKSILFILLVIHIGSYSYCQDESITRYLTSIAYSTNFGDCSEKAYNDTLYSERFDFQKLKPIKTGKEKSNFSLYYKNGHLEKLSYKDTTFRYDAYFTYHKKKTSFTVFHYRNPQKEDGEFIRGLFIYDPALGDCYFWGIYHHDFITLEYPDGQERLTIDTVSSKNVTAILRLDSCLFPEQRINCYGGEILTISDIIYTKSAVYESILVPAQQTCDSKLHLDSLTIRELGLLMKHETCSRGIGLRSKNNVDNPEIPLWTSIFHSYGTIPTKKNEPRLQRGRFAERMGIYLEEE